ncbi:hypothetical protein HN843_00515 [bacterium]|jgi:hypothetical protein|nr:hypothetical protein [bacterium]
MADTFRRDNHPLITLLIAIFIVTALLLPATRNGCGPHEDYYKFSFNAMDCVVDGQINVWDRTNKIPAIEIVKTAVDSVITVTEIELSTLNNFERGKKFKSSAWLDECLRVADLLKVTSGDLKVNSADKTVVLKNGIIDLSRLNRGFAVDKTVAALKKYGTSSALINIGGNYFALGKREKHEKWEIKFAEITIGLVNRACTIEDNLLVIGRNSTTTDAIASILSKLPENEIIEYVETNFSSNEAMLIDGNGDLKMTPRAKKYILK